MTNWGGPYLAAMLLTSPAIADPVDSIETDAGTIRRIIGIVTHAAIARTGEPVAVNLLLLLFAGGDRVRDPLTISVMDPAGFSQGFPPIPIEWNGPAEPTRYVLPLVITAEHAGVYWVRAQIRHRMLSRVPLTVEVLPALPAPYLTLAD